MNEEIEGKKQHQPFSVSVVVIAIDAVTFLFFSIYLYVFRKFNGESIKSYARRTLDERITMIISMGFNAFYMCSVCLCFNRTLFDAICSD